MKVKTAAYLLCALSVLCSAQIKPEPKADKIFLHGNIYTGVTATHGMRRAEALAVRGDRIEAAGSESEILKLKGPSTEVIDLDGRFVMPGLDRKSVV